jgi:hypothetical protein
MMSGVTSSLTGPHLSAYTASSSRPIFQQLNWNEDNINLSFAAYYDGTWRSNYASSNFQIRKLSDRLSIMYGSGVAAGSALTWSTAMTVNPKGFFGFGTDVPRNQIDITGQVTIRGGSAASGKVLTCINPSGDAEWRDGAGLSGFAGYSGYGGFSGAVGASGFSGRSGYSGFSGFSGAAGGGGRVIIPLIFAEGDTEMAVNDVPVGNKSGLWNTLLGPQDQLYPRGMQILDLTSITLGSIRLTASWGNQTDPNTSIGLTYTTNSGDPIATWTPLGPSLTGVGPFSDASITGSVSIGSPSVLYINPVTNNSSTIVGQMYLRKFSAVLYGTSV